MKTAWLLKKKAVAAVQAPNQRRVVKLLEPGDWLRLSAQWECCGGCSNDTQMHCVFRLIDAILSGAITLKRALWCEADFARCILHSGDTKHGKANVPLSPSAPAGAQVNVATALANASARQAWSCHR